MIAQLLTPAGTYATAVEPCHGVARSDNITVKSHKEDARGSEAPSCGNDSSPQGTIRSAEQTDPSAAAAPPTCTYGFIFQPELEALVPLLVVLG